jgi:hypothetical protein
MTETDIDMLESEYNFWRKQFRESMRNYERAQREDNHKAIESEGQNVAYIISQMDKIRQNYERKSE